LDVVDGDKCRQELFGGVHVPVANAEHGSESGLDDIGDLAGCNRLDIPGDNDSRLVTWTVSKVDCGRLLDSVAHPGKTRSFLRPEKNDMMTQYNRC
jgi:hypothetical protein